VTESLSQVLKRILKSTEISMSIRRNQGLVLSEVMFILLLISALIMVAFVGRLAMEEAKRTELAKETAIELLKWFDELASDSSKIPAALQEKCKPVEPAEGAAAKTGPAVTDKTWAGCRDALLAEGGPLHGLTNPFEPEYLIFSEKCDRGNRATRGTVVVEESLKVAPGQPAAFAPIAHARVLEKDLGIRLAICDKGSFVIKIGESKL